MVGSKFGASRFRNLLVIRNPPKRTKSRKSNARIFGREEVFA